MVLVVWLTEVRFMVFIVEPAAEWVVLLLETSIMFKAFLERVRRGVGVMSADIRSVAGK
jgi:hypothetical protein